MKLFKLKLIFGIAVFIYSRLIFAMEPNQGCQDLRELYEDIRNHTILNFSHHEMKIIRSININAFDTGGFSQAGAYIDSNNGGRYIVFSCTHMALVSLAAAAMAYIGILPEPDRTEAGKAIEGYLRYLIYSISFNKELISYPDFVGFSLPINMQKNFQQVAFSIRYQMASAVLFHEFGHHVLNHLNTTTHDSAFSRAREQEADKWAIRAMLKSTMFPMVSVVLFKMFNELNRSDLKDEWKLKHPASTRRAIYYFENGMAVLEDPIIIKIFSETKNKTGISLASAKTRMKKILEDYKNILEVEKEIVDDPLLYWSTQARKQDTMGLIEMGYIYYGKYGVKRDLQKSRNSFCLAAKLEEEYYQYDYVSKASAHYLCGNIYGFWQGEGEEKDFNKAKYHLNKSADMGFISAEVALKHLKE